MPARKTAGTAPDAPAETPSKAGRASRPRRALAAIPEVAALPDETLAAGLLASGAEAAASPDALTVHEDGSWIEADAVEIHQGAVARVDSSELHVSQGAIGAARADRIDVQIGAIGAVLGREVSISQGGAGSVLAQAVQVDQSFIRTLVARDVTFRKPGAALIVIAQRVSGDVRVLLDWRGAIAFGAAFGLVAGLFRRGRRGG
ncbi:MAG: hypothetical protein ABIV26_06845 [Candidatus Limnocylindrales bacterium]